MPNFNLALNTPVDENYQQGLLPQRNHPGLWYQDTSSRSNLLNFELNSENRRILKKTEKYSYRNYYLREFPFYNNLLQKKLFQWSKELRWGIPATTIKTLFNSHIFNYLYIWYNSDLEEIAYSICYQSDKIFHIAYVFYNPTLSHSDLPIRLSLQAVIDSHQNNLNYCYLGRFNPDTKVGFYKRNLPGFEYFSNGTWLKFEH